MVGAAAYRLNSGPALAGSRLRRRPADLLRHLRIKNLASSHGLQQPLEGLQFVGFASRLVPADAVDTREAHRQAALVTRRALQALESHLQHQTEIPVGAHRADRTEALDRVLAHEGVELFQ